MRKLILFAGIAATILSSCKEVPPPISFSDTLAVDSTYVLASVPATDPHNVLFEDFTGSTCPNCPVFKENVLEPLLVAHPGRINVLGLYVTDYVQTNPVEGSKYDLRDSDATKIEQSIYQALYAMPVAGVDRMPFGNSSQGSAYQIFSGNWAGSVNTQLAMNDSVNLDVTSQYSSVSGIATIETKVTYLYNMNTIQNISVAIVEDSIIDFQEYPGRTDSFYHYEDVFRGLVTTAPFGDEILPAKSLPNYPAKEAGRVYIRRFSYKVKAEWVPKHCKVVAFVHKSGAQGGSNVYQSKQCKLIN